MRPQRIRQNHLLDWAATMDNSAMAHLQMARHPTITNPEPPLREALGHTHDAPIVCDPRNMARSTTPRPRRGVTISLPPSNAVPNLNFRLNRPA
jgi:hypothetical protein